ncbi:MAG TPA: hypothetical protein D7H93_01660, partial [Candidatus Poseidoniales archaeon]
MVMMGKKHTAFGFVILMLSASLGGLLIPSSSDSIAGQDRREASLEDAFVGFSINDDQDIWNQTPMPSIAMPQGFDFLSVYDYSDVGVLINNNSEASRTIGWAFVSARNISSERVFIFD